MSQNHEWYAVRARSNCETKIHSILAEKGIENYLPTFREVHQWKDRKKVVEQPLFPGYLFVRMANCRESRLSVLCSDGVVTILGTGETIVAITEEEIEAGRPLLTNIAGCQAHPLLQEGAWVRVKRGALKNMEGLLVRVKNQTRLGLSMTLLSQSVSTEVDASDVEYVQSVTTSRRAA